MTDLLIVRHPETEANVDGRFVGQGESPLTADGRRQARRLPMKIAKFRPTVIWSSPLSRALIVAQRAHRLCSADLKVDDRLIELDFGQAHGLTWEETVEAGIVFDYRLLDAPVAPGGESRRDLAVRVTDVLDEIAEVGGRHVLVCHAGVMRALLTETLGLVPRQMWLFGVHSAQMATVRVIDGVGQLVEYAQG